MKAIFRLAAPPAVHVRIASRRRTFISEGRREQVAPGKFRALLCVYCVLLRNDSRDGLPEISGAALILLQVCFSEVLFLVFPDEGHDGAGGEQPPADHPVLSKHRSPHRAAVLAAHKVQRLQNRTST